MHHLIVFVKKTIKILESERTNRRIYQLKGEMTFIYSAGWMSNIKKQIYVYLITQHFLVLPPHPQYESLIMTIKNKSGIDETLRMKWNIVYERLLIFDLVVTNNFFFWVFHLRILLSKPKVKKRERERGRMNLWLWCVICVCEWKKIFCDRIDIFTAFFQHKLLGLLLLLHREEQVLVVIRLRDLEVFALKQAVVHVVLGRRLSGLARISQLETIWWFCTWKN